MIRNYELDHNHRKLDQQQLFLNLEYKVKYVLEKDILTRLKHNSS